MTNSVKIPKTDALTDLLNKAVDKNFVVDDSKKSKDKRNRKLVMDDEDGGLGLSEEEINKMRDEVLSKIENHITDMKSKIQKDNLSDYMLENRIELLEKSKFMLNEYMVTVLTQLSASSRAFEVLAKMIETIASVNDSVVNVNDDKKKTKGDKDEASIASTTHELVKDLVKQNIEEFQAQEKFRTKDKDSIKVVSNGGK